MPLLLLLALLRAFGLAWVLLLPLGLWQRYQRGRAGLTREPAARLYYTANRWLVLGLTVLVAVRVGLSLLQVARLWDGVDAHVDWLARQGSLLAVAGLLLGHYLAYYWGLRRRLPR